MIEALFGVAASLLRDGEGWAVEEFTRFGTHNSPTSTRPGTTTRRSAASGPQTIDELPLEWFFAPGVVLDMTGQGGRRRGRRGRRGGGARRIGHDSSRCDIVLVRTGRDAFLRAARATWRAARA